MTVVQLHPTTAPRSEPAPFRVGVNYWPATKGVSLWKDFDIDEVHGDMNTIAEMGLDLVRVYLTWEDFQPEPDGVNCCALARLTRLCDAVAAEGLKAIITLNTGHLSGHNWVPPWLLDSQLPPFGDHPIISKGRRVSGGYRDPYTDPVARKAALRLVRAVARTLADHQAVWAYDLGSEPDRFARHADSASQREWYVELAGALRNLDDRHAITCGLCANSLVSSRASRVDDAFVSSTFASIQVNLATLAMARNALDPDVAPFSCALTAALSSKPCFASDWGLSLLAQHSGRADVAFVEPNGPQSVERAAVLFAERALPGFLQVGALGALLGNYSDLDESLFESPPYDTCVRERSRGLLRVDGTLKPHAQIIRRFAESNPLVLSPPRLRATVDISNDEFYANPQAHSLRLYETFLAQNSGLASASLAKPIG